MVNKQDFIAKVAEKSGFTKVDTKAFMNAMEEVIFECVKAQECGIRLIVLIEEVPPGGDVDRRQSPLDRYGRPKYKFDPVTLSKVMATMTERYDVQFRFCDGRSTGKVLIEYLKGERT